MSERLRDEMADKIVENLFFRRVSWRFLRPYFCYHAYFRRFCWDSPARPSGTVSTDSSLFFDLYLHHCLIPDDLIFTLRIEFLCSRSSACRSQSSHRGTSCQERYFFQFFVKYRKMNAGHLVRPSSCAMRMVKVKNIYRSQCLLEASKAITSARIAWSLGWLILPHGSFGVIAIPGACLLLRRKQRDHLPTGRTVMTAI